MRIVLFYHSLVSDWNHGNAHFLRGVVRELLRRGHDVIVHEPQNGWSLTHLIDDGDEDAVAGFRTTFPDLRSRTYGEEFLRESSTALDAALDGADLVLVHEWTDPVLVRRIGERARENRFRLLFHDTHHRSATVPEQVEALDLSEYDGVLAFGEAVRRRYLDRGWTQRAWTWHEAADVSHFGPRERPLGPLGDLVWVGNWGDEERNTELRRFLLCPASWLALRSPGFRAEAYGVRYPPEARTAFARAGVRYRGWLPNHRVPDVYAGHRVTVHVPRRAYVHRLPGVPTIRIFEALACGIPLVTAPWEDVEGLFSEGEDYLKARDAGEMTSHLDAVIRDPGLARSLSANGRRAILDRHTCAHRVDELLRIHRSLSAPAGRAVAS